VKDKLLLTANILRRTDGTGEERLASVLEKDPASPEIVMLVAGPTDRKTYIEQAMPGLSKLIDRRVRLSAVEYMVSRIMEVRQRIFDDVFTEVIIVRNANVQDVHDVAEIGGEDRIVIIHSQGTRSSVTMTDDLVINNNLEKPKKKLRALLLDNYGEKTSEPEILEAMGDGISDNVSVSDR